MNGRALVFEGPGDVAVRSFEVEKPGPEDVLVETTVSAISPGTELLIYRGEVPEGMTVDTSIDSLDGDFSYPLEYGYAAVGTVRAVGEDVDGDWQDTRVFGFEPHRTHFTASPDVLVELPSWISTDVAALLPTVETATNLVLDCAPLVGERVIVFGAGPVGLATIRLLAQFPIELVVAEPISTRRELARTFGADAALEPAAARSYFDDCEPGGADLAIELSGRPATIDDAIDAIGYGGRLVIGSWYGTRRASIDLGSSFHRNDVTIRSSQVSRLAPERRGRWTNGRRLVHALEQLTSVEADSVISHRIPFENASEAYPLLENEAAAVIQVLLTYD